MYAYLAKKNPAIAGTQFRGFALITDRENHCAHRGALPQGTIPAKNGQVCTMPVDIEDSKETCRYFSGSSRLRLKGNPHLKRHNQGLSRFLPQFPQNPGLCWF